MNGGYYSAGKWWQDEKLWKAAQGHETVGVNVADYIGLDVGWNIGSLQNFAIEAQKVLSADYSYPIILSEKGHIVDGRHRIVHAYMDGVETIRGVVLRDEDFPEPDYDEYEALKRKEEGND